MAYFKMLLFAIYVISNLVLFLGHHLCDVWTTLEHCKYTIFLIYIYYRNVLSIHIRYAILWRQTWQKYCRYAIIGFDSQWKNTAEVWIPYSRAWGRGFGGRMRGRGHLLNPRGDVQRPLLPPHPCWFGVWENWRDRQ